ncbi:Mucin-5B [Mactra antiquata]
MALGAFKLKVACFALLCCSALVDSRAARKKRQIDSNLIGQTGGSSSNLCQPLPAPGHGTIACGAGFPFYACTASCDAGYIFPGGLTSDKRECDQMFGEWFDPPGKDIPDCVPNCDPKCANGGQCILPNTCTCQNGFMGKYCQYPASNCAAPPDPQNGKLTCNQDTSGSRCTMTCNQGYKPKWAIAPEYVCTPDGFWAPHKSEIPDCVTESTVLNNTHATSPSHPSPGSARCVAWGQDHYRTFDNKVYHYKGSCSYVLVKDAVANTFHIHVHNDPSCQPGHRCKRELEIFMGKDIITLTRDENGASVKFNGQAVPIPSNRGGVIFEKVSHYTIIRSNIGFQVRWDGYEMVFVTVTDELRGKTQGLCGVYDGDQTNEFTTDSGNVVSEPASFVSTWKRSLAGETCPDSPQTGCSTADEQVVASATSTCEALNGQDFAICHHAVDPAKYIAACKEDCCSNSGQSCSCSSFEAYASECLSQNIELNWRANSQCPVQCPNNQVHKECGSMCQKTCQSPVAACETHDCIDGCFCPDDMVLHNDKCIQKSECPCSLNNKEYKSGDVVPKECNKCTCMNGAWQCTNKKCEATCSAIGDPHYMTFDGKRYDFMGTCSYYLIYDPNFDIIADNVKCGHGQASCTKSVTIHIGGHQIKMDHNHELFIDGVEVTSTPYENDGIKLYMVSSLFMKAELSNGIKILWDGRTRAYITVPPSFVNKTKGLCGTYDFNQKNDFRTKEGDIETNINAFGNRWKTVPTCTDVPINVTGHPCDENVNRRNQSEQYCNYLKGDVFQPCHDVVDPDEFYKSCLYDMCACSENLRDCLCPMLGEYASTCAAAGVSIHWRLQIPECHLPCKGGQEYQVCPNECTRTCYNIANDPGCTQSSVCAEGCGCPANQTLDDSGNCIAIAQCPCKFSNQEFAAGATVERGDQICTCYEGRWSCAAKPTNVFHIGGVEKICPPDMEYTTCVSDCPATCENMNNATAVACNTTTCRDGCVCKQGYVREGNTCVLRSECPCYHGGRAYKEGETFSMECNQCTCRSRLWVCESKECPAVCSAYGDSHYTTFDGKSYEFQGSCDYVFAKSTADNPIKFEITTENIPCGTTGVTCTRSISFSIGEQGTANFYRIQLVQGKPVVPEPGSPFTVREVGNFIIITTPQGITLEWDKGTRLYLKLRTEHRNQVEGLCGNFDGNQKNDFTTPQGGPAASRATTFADSWKVHAFCGNSKEIIDTCQSNTERQPWAQQKCNIIASKVFESCHGIVPYQEYVDRCIFDGCACDTGGDCECLCTAVAAYAHQCAMNGVPVQWRTEEFCPIMCEDCLAYKACISICPKKTCDNRLVYDTLTQDCGQETCVEGCDIEPCPPGQVYESDKAPLVCIPEAFCNTTCLTINGKEYKEGERILDEKVCRMDCEVCFCDNHEIKRSGVCTGTTPGFTTVSTVSPKFNSATPPLAKTLPPACLQSGPTVWMSVSTPTAFNQGDVESFAILRRSYTFCDVSQISAIECRVVGTQTSSAASGQRVFCDARNGLKCYHSDQRNGEQCLNYEVRITCDCGLNITTTVAPNNLTEGSPTIRVPTPTKIVTTPQPNPDHQCKEPGWTNWLNYNKPSGGDDIEVLPNIIKAYSFCREDQVEYIQCRQVSNQVSYDKTDDVNTICSTKGGFACYGARQPDGKCDDYEIRVYCNCQALCQKPMISDVRTVLNRQFTASSSASGVSPSDARLYTVGGWQPRVDDKSPWLQVDLVEPIEIAGIITQGINNGPLYTKQYTVSYSNDCKTFTDVKLDSGNTQIFDGNTDFDTPVQHMFIKAFNARCIRINPIDYNGAVPGLRFELLGCRTFVPISLTTQGTMPTPGTRTFTPDNLSFKTPTPSPGIQQTGTPTVSPSGGVVQSTPTVVTSSTKMPYTCKQGWSQWMNIDLPSVQKSWETNGPGDVEPITELRKYYSFCAKPTGIKCQSATTFTPYTDPLNQDIDVECNLEKGLQCLNAKQGGYNCDDYEVAVYCECASTPTVTTPTTGVTGTPFSPKPGCGWTTFMNSYHRTQSSIGEYETIHNLRMMYEFCEFPAQIQCRDVATKQDFRLSGQTGVTCDVNHGLVCEDIGQNGKYCIDYEVRVYCTDDCTSTVSPVIETSSTAVSSRASPHVDPFETPTPTPGIGTNGVPTPSQGVDASNTPTASPGIGTNGVPTASPGVDASKTPSASPGIGTNGVPTASPGVDASKTPTASPGIGTNGVPTASPGVDASKTPTASPGIGTNGVPTASPGVDASKTPTASPGIGTNGVPTASPGVDASKTPTASPGIGTNGVPTASPGVGASKTPTASPGIGTNGVPTASPGVDASKTPTASPGIGTNGVPTASPGVDASKTPTASPGIGTNGVPTASPGVDASKTPTASPGIGTNGVPTASPGVDASKTPTASPGIGTNGVPTASPGVDASKTPTASPGIGTNGVPTASPGVDASKTPTASPGIGTNGVPTASPGVDASKTPTASPGIGTNGVPTASPGVDASKTPTASPGIGTNGVPTASPGVDASKTPTASPGIGTNGVPTASPGVDASKTPTASPGIGTNSVPTASPGVDASKTPTASPGIGTNGVPTASPGVDASKTPTASPGIGTNGVPTASPGVDASKTPTASPGVGTNGVPTASPGVDASKTPTASPGIGTNGVPTASPGVDASKTPTASPGIGTNGVPTASPGVDASKTPTASPGIGTNGVPTASPGVDASKTPTASPGIGTNGVPTASPGVDASKTPTASPGIGTNGVPTASPGVGYTGTPTASPGLNPSETPSVSPHSVSQATPSTSMHIPWLMMCHEGWTEWINEGNPNKLKGDYESYKSIPGYPTTCDEIITSDCAIASTGQKYSYSGQDVKCDRTGLECVDSEEQSCLDYKIRFYCSCRPTTKTTQGGPDVVSTATVTGETTLGTGITSTGTPGVVVTPSTSSYSCIQGWTKPMSGSTPSRTGDDLETFTELRKKYHFCNAENIIAIRCTGLISEKTAEEMEEKATCDVKNGFVCYGKDQFDEKCDDYAVQVYCDCSITTVNPDVTTTVEPSVVSGLVPTARPSNFPQVTPTARPPHYAGEVPTPRPHCDIPLGVGHSSSVSNNQLTASTVYNYTFEAFNGRLDSTGSWIPRFTDDKQWIQVDFGEHTPERIAGISTQGRPEVDQWVESFYVETSMDGLHWYRYTDKGANKPTLFQANFNRNTVVSSMFDREIDARFVRIVPKSWHGAIALRFEVLSCYGPTTDQSTVSPPSTAPTTKLTTEGSFTPTKAPLCLEPMGIDNSLMVKDNQLKASSEKDRNTAASTGRLYNEFGGWQPSTTEGKQWIQVDFLQPKYISGVLTQGLPHTDKWSSQFYISTSTDGMTFTPYSEVVGGAPKFFDGNSDRESIVKNVFNRNVEARYVRLNVIEGGPAGIGMRFNLIGCYSAVPTPSPSVQKTTALPPTPMPTPGVTQILPVCTIPMGVKNSYIISASQIKASSAMGSNHSLSKREAVGVQMPWTPDPTDPEPWIEIDFLEPKTLSGVLTKGHAYKAEWVTTFQIYTSLDGKNFTPYSHVINSTTPTTFNGNTDNTTEVKNLFNRNIIGRYFRIYPKTWHTAASLMFEVLGCNPSEPYGSTTQSPALSTEKSPKVTGVTSLTGQQGGATTKTVSQQSSTLGFGMFTPPMPNITAPPRVCVTPMGLENSAIVGNSQITASSHQDANYVPSQGRIYSSSGWAPSPDDKTPWVQVDFKRPKLISGIRTQAEKNGDRWITKYTISTSVDGKTFIPYSDKLGETTAKVFTGNNNNVDLKRHLFNRNITAQYVRIYPIEWHGSSAAFRFNLLGCNPDVPQTPVITTASPKPTTSAVTSSNQTTDSTGSSPSTVNVQGSTTSKYGNLVTIPGLPLIPPSFCILPMGIENHLIVKDQQLSASSSKDVLTGPERARLYGDKDGSFAGAWVAGENNLKQYIQVDFLAPYYVGGVVTQGRTDANQWVTKYEIFYSTDGKHYQSVPRSVVDNTPMVFTGNSDRNTPETHMFPLVAARWIRIHPLEWHESIAMRFNMLGCMSPTSTPITTSTTSKIVTQSPTSGVVTSSTSVMATACAYWTPWVSASKPDMVGEYETAWELRNMISFCDMKYVTNTECRTVGTHISYDQAGEENVVCNNNLKGLVCFAQNQTDGSCMDYEIRVFCDECSSPTTPQVDVTGHTSSYECKSKWLPWINTMTPTTDNNYVEHEFMSLAKQQELCYGGHITRIECQTANGIPYYSVGAIGTTCDVTSGFTCRNEENIPIPCDDYKVRYYCQCEVTTASPSVGTGGVPTASPRAPSGGVPTASPSVGTGGVPTASPGAPTGGVPTASPSVGTGGVPTASPGAPSGGVPTASPGAPSGGVPTASPGAPSGGVPTASPGAPSGGVPTASPSVGTGGVPTASPGAPSGGVPTASPSVGTGGVPTASPGAPSGGVPTASPSVGTGGVPTASPGAPSGGVPTASPSVGTGGVPTASPGAPSGGVPTASPSVGTGGVPTASPGAPSGGVPTASPGTSSGGVPTASPGAPSGGVPTASPGTPSGGVPTASPGAPSGGVPTASPGAPSGGVPTASPGAPSGGVPTASPGAPSGGVPTASPGTSSGGVPTASPGAPSGGVPTASPGTPSGGVPTASPGAPSGGVPTASPGAPSGGVPTASPGAPSGGVPTASPGAPSGGVPTASPSVGTGGVPTASPGAPSGGVPTASPGAPSGGVPTASPGAPSGGVPTASPSVGTGGVPTASPGAPSGGVPTASPGAPSGGVPTASPSVGTGGVPTASPGAPSSGVPTASPGAPSGGVPTASPSIGTGGVPTASPGAPSGGVPTASPGAPSGGVPTASPSVGTGGVPTASPGAPSGGVPTASPFVGTGKTPTSHVIEPTSCRLETKWSTWINRNSPSVDTDETEYMTDAEKLKFCGYGKLISVECQTIYKIPSYSAGDLGTTCDLSSGLKCSASDNIPIGCQDYMIRYQCQEEICGGAPTTMPVPGTLGPNTDTTATPSLSPKPNNAYTVTPSASPTTVCRNIQSWSPWINRDKPTVGTSDREVMSGEEKKTFCPSGTLVTVECATADNTPWYETGEILACSVENGLECINDDNFPYGCQDYMIRYQCEELICGSTITPPTVGSTLSSSVSPGTDSTETPTAKPTYGDNGKTPSKSPTKAIISGVPTAGPGTDSNITPTASPGLLCVNTTKWSMWVNKNHPDVGGGDKEYLSPEELQRFCQFGSISRVECQTVDGKDYTLTGDIATCTPKAGLDCTEFQNYPVGCVDYKVRYECTEYQCNTPTAKPTTGPSGTPTAGPPIEQKGTPTVQPTIGNSGTPTAEPPIGQTGTPTAQPTIGNSGTPTAEPPIGQTGTPTAEPTIGNSGTPTAEPPIGQTGTPTAEPTIGNSGTPTAGPPIGQTGSPTAQPTIGNSGTPTAGPPIGKTGTPTAEPPIGKTGTPTAQTTAGSVSTSTNEPSTTVNACTKTHWSSWINQDNPNVGKGDFERLSKSELDAFCIGGIVTSIECLTADGISHDSSGEIVTCDLSDGFSCKHEDNAPVPCSDFKIRYLCKCSDQTTVSPSSTISPSVPVPVEPTLHLRCGWSPWLNGDRPNVGLGDLETISSLKTKFGLCKNIVDIECRVANTNTDVKAAGQTEVSCDAVNGLRCYNGNQNGGMCYDYEVSVLCWSPECSVTQTGPSTLTPGTGPTAVFTLSTAVCPPGEIWEPCATKCNYLCQGYAAITGLCDNNDNPCVPMCVNPQSRPTCSAGELLKDKSTCVKKEMCPCLKPDGTIAQAFETWQDKTNECTSCQCTNNEIRCTKFDNCSSVSTPGVTTVSPTYNDTSPTIRPIITHPECGWTAWINSDRPGFGNGDLETISKIRRLHNFCAAPVMIECRDVHTRTPTGDIHQNVTCDLQAGLKCLNWDNDGDCSDYEVRFFCPCLSTTVSPGQPSTPTVSPVIDTSKTPTAGFSIGTDGVPTSGPVLCGWTNWMDGHKPDEFAGESELFSDLRLNHQFCQDTDIQSVQCRVVNSHLMINETQQVGVLCDIPTGGLMCMAFDQPSSKCLDYEIRVYCEPKGVDCSATPTASPKVGTTATPTASPNINRNSTLTPTVATEVSTQTSIITGSTVIIQTGSNCNNTWSEWINRDNSVDGHETESMSPEEKSQFCPGGKIIAIECATTSGIPSDSTGEIMECTIERGLVCNDADNDPIPCSDYKVRYECLCPVTTVTVPLSVTTTTAMPTPNFQFPVVCREKMGMESGTIRQEMITVSSSRDGSTNPSNARLNSPGAWVANTNNQNQYIQVNFLDLQLITGLITQGRHGIPSYVTSYKVYHSTDGFTWTPYQSNGVDKIFTANKDSDTKSTNWFEHPIRAQYIRVVPQTWQGVIAMRLEILGCYKGYMTEATPSHPPTTLAPVKTPVTRTISDGCIVWDQWINQGHLSLTSGGDTEPIADVQAASQVCKTPIKIECVRANDELPISQTGQTVKCNLWDGFECFNADNVPLCYDYKVRLGCLKNTPECLATPVPPSTIIVSAPQHISTVPVTGVVYPRVLPCFEGMDTSACPSEGCQDGLYCNGRQCVRKNECPCIVDGKVMQPGGFKENSYCDTCQCIAGEVMCTPKSCPTCDAGFVVTMNETTCKCGCDACESGEFRCANGICLSKNLRCDGIVDCIDDEVGCVSTPVFTPPPLQTITVPVRNTATTVVSPDLCKSSWSAWYNRDNPDSGGGDLEVLTPEELQQFCPYGKISAIECITTENIPFDSTGDIMQCTLEGGAICLNDDNAPIPCSDYKIRYYCKCDEKPTLKPGSLATETPTLTPARNTGGTGTVTLPGQTTTTKIPPVPCTSKWSNWINTDSPDTGDGDREEWTKADKDGFCIGGHITGIECITTDGIPFDSTGEIMQCTLEGGLVCLNADNAPIPCSDYKIKYYCACDATPTSGPEVLSTLTPTKELSFGGSSTAGLIPSTKSVLPLCIDKWSSWINTDSPTIGDGDFEEMTSEQKKAFCPYGKITSIECITTDLISSDSTGEIMQCTLEGGSACLNSDNAPIPCSDYKIRYFCKCDEVSTPVLSTTEGAPPTISSRITPPPFGVQTPQQLACIQSRWSKWINRDKPDSGDGDIEKMTSKELGVFCPGGRVNRIECNTVDDIPSHSSGEIISCSINNGLECLNMNNLPVPCSDYKVRYFCLCEDQVIGSTSSYSTNKPAANHNTIRPAGICKPEECPIPVRPMVKEGEVIRTVMDDLNCCMKYEVFCKSDTCTPSSLTCTAPMMVQPIPKQDCCPTYRCMCPSQCPEMKRPACENGTVIEVEAECNCTQYACLSKPLTTVPPSSNNCTYMASRTVVNGTDQPITSPVEEIHQIGDTWSDGICRQCLCEQKSGRAETSCHEQTCPDCQKGYKKVDVAGKCCGECKQLGCLFNEKIYSDGDSMPTKRNCYTKQCNYDFELETFVATETSITCPSHSDLRVCQQNESAFDSNGCCMKCKQETIKPNTTNLECQTCAPRLVFGQPDDTIGYFNVMDNMELCGNLAPIPDLKECSGYCGSRSFYSHVMRGFTNSCNCCQSSKVETRTVTLTCKSGRTITKSYSVPTACGCSECTGGK